MRVLVVDIGGTHVKVLATGQQVPREFPSGPTLTAEQMVDGVKRVAAECAYDAVSIGTQTRSSAAFDCGARARQAPRITSRAMNTCRLTA